MRTGRILHPELIKELTKMGHADTILVTDAGAPIPNDMNRIDLALAPGLMDLRDILKVLVQEMFFEQVTYASEVPTRNPNLNKDIAEIFRGSGADFTLIPHEELIKRHYSSAKLVIRSGSYEPWGNFALSVSTDPDAWFDDSMEILPDYVKRSKAIADNAYPTVNVEE